jgi:apolipoprotein N-acyltransferase
MLVNLTNDSWSGSVAAEMQHLGLAVFRAVENRRPMIRGTNSGITCLVTPSGKIIDPMEPFTKGWRLYEVPLGQKQGMTFYTRFPDLFAYLAMAGSVVLLFSAIVHYRQDKRRSRYDHLFDESVFWDE